MIILQATVQPRLFFRFDRDFSAFGRASRLRIGASARLWFTSSFTSSSRSNWPFTTSGPRMPRRRLSRSLSDTCCAGLALKPALRLLLIHTVRSNLEVMLLFFFLPRLFFCLFQRWPEQDFGKKETNTGRSGRPSSRLVARRDGGDSTGAWQPSWFDKSRTLPLWCQYMN